VNTLPLLAAGLARHGMRGSMPVAIVERGFRRDQRTTIADLAGIVAAAGIAGATSPAVIVVGEVVRLAHDGDRTASELMERAAGFAAVAT
jgi:uroporphyrin-III C-methyltransferase